MAYDYMTDKENLIETGAAYKAMLGHAKDFLQNRIPQEISKLAAVEYDAGNALFTVPSLGQTINVSYPDYGVVFSSSGATPAVFWTFSILHYLSIADGTPLAADLITFRMLQGGGVRGGNFDRDCARILGNAFGKEPVAHIEMACQALGAKLIKANSDICAVFPFLPNYPITVKIWLADDEMPGSGQMLLNSQADHYLSMEDAVLAGTLLLDFLQKQYELMFR